MGRLTVIVPVFNEETTISEVLRLVRAAPTPGYDKEVIVVDDGSTDGTGRLLTELQERYGLILLRHAANRGKGAAVRTALERASGDLVLIQDADLEYDPADYAKLLAAFGPETPVVYGSRNLGAGGQGYALYNWGGRFLTFCANLLFGADLTDINTCYKLFRTDVIRGLGLTADGFEFCEEVTAKVLRGGWPIKEVAISYRPRKFVEGKKIRLRDGWLGLKTIIKWRLTPPFRPVGPKKGGKP